jgi:hypothetical protein
MNKQKQTHIWKRKTERDDEEIEILLSGGWGIDLVCIYIYRETDYDVINYTVNESLGHSRLMECPSFSYMVTQRSMLSLTSPTD